MSDNKSVKNKQLSAYGLVLVMLFSIVAGAGFSSAATSRQYTTEVEPMDVALADFDCDGDLDMVTANDQSLKISVLLNNDGSFEERVDIWTSANTSQGATFEDHSNTQQVEAGDFDGDGDQDIVIYARNRPFVRDANGALVVDKVGNMTVIDNTGDCGADLTFQLTATFDMVYVWDLAVGDIDKDGKDDIAILELQADIKTQVVKVFRGPVTASTQPITTTLGDSTANSYRELELGDWGETQSLGLQDCEDLDLWLVRSEGVDYLTGTATNPGKSDNVTVVEYDCFADTFGQFQWTASGGQTTQGQSFHVHALGPDFGGFDIGDMDENGVIDVVAINDGNTQNVTYATINEATNTYSASTKVFFGNFIAWEVTIADLNSDQEPDFLHACKFGADESTSSTGETTTVYYLNEPTSIGVTLSDGNGGHMAPLYYGAATRPTTAVVGQLVGDANSALDIVLGHDSYHGSITWNDNWGWEGSYDRIIVIEMDYTDLAVSDIEFSNTDRYVGLVGEGTRDVNITVTNTGMDVLSGSTTVDVVIEEVDEAASSNVSVYAMDWDTAEDKSGCGSGCNWRYESYHGDHHWMEETTHNTGVTSSNFNDATYSANSNNPTDFMWSGTMETDSNGDEWSGYGGNWDEAMVLEDVDLTGADRAWLSAELFRHLGYSATFIQDQNGPILYDLWDDLAMIEVLSDAHGWELLACPSAAYFDGVCPSGQSIWGGYDTDRVINQQRTGYASAIDTYGVWASQTNYGWNSFTEEGYGAFELSRYAGEIVDIRFRFKTGWEGSNSDEDDSNWQGYDGFAIDNVTIWKQQTVFKPGNTPTSAPINLNGMAPNEDRVVSISADLLNGSTYRVTATIDGNSFGDEQSLNDDLVQYVQVFNLYDPAVLGITSFKPGEMYAADLLPIEVEVENWGNTEVDFDLRATVYSAIPNDVFCGSPSNICYEPFEGGANTPFRFTDDNNQKGQIHDESVCVGQNNYESIFGGNAYWFGHPCNTATDGYGDVWQNESFTIPAIDLTNMQGDFVALNFDYYAETYFEWDSEGNIYTPGDYSAITLDWEKDGNQYNGLLVAQWTDFNDDGSCRIDSNDDGITNSSEPIDRAELTYIGDESNINGGTGNYNLFFNSYNLKLSRSIDLTHIYIRNQTAVDAFGNYPYECMSLKDSVVDINFEFVSNEDGKNGLSKGLRGVGFDNITLKEFTFTQDAVYENTVTGLDADQLETITVAEHDFSQGIYKIDIESIFDNTDPSTNWYQDEEISEANNLASVIFTVQSVNLSLLASNQLACWDDAPLACVYPIDDVLKHEWAITARNGVLEAAYDFYMTIEDVTDPENVILKYNVTSTLGTTVLEPREQINNVGFTPWNEWDSGHTYSITFFTINSDDNEVSGNSLTFEATFMDEIDIAILSNPSSRVDNIIRDIDALGMTYTLFPMNEWDDYLDDEWMNEYNKIVLPWQELIDAKPVGGSTNGKGYYEKLGLNQGILEDFMNAGGTVQVHLDNEAVPYYEYSSSTGKSLLPFNLDVEERTGDDTITKNKITVQDPYHPLFEGLDISSLDGFNGGTYVTKAIVDASSGSSSAVPLKCVSPSGSGDISLGGSFHPIIHAEDSPKNVILGTCSNGLGGMILTTLDVSTQSDPVANDANFNLLGQMLLYNVTPYPDKFGVLGNGVDITINGEVPSTDDTGYKIYNMRSNATLEFGFQTDASVPLTADWTLLGSTLWDHNQDNENGEPDHTRGDTVTSKFCDKDPTEPTLCKQGAQWTVKLYLHDDQGHARILQITLKTSNLEADTEQPIAVLNLDVDAYQNIAVHEATAGTGANQYLIILQEDQNQNDIPMPVNLDASDSYDPDALSGNGIARYVWTVYFDCPYGEDCSKKVITQDVESNSAFDGNFEYTFSNVTKEGTLEQVIRIELIVFDNSNKPSDTAIIRFVVGSSADNDAEPEIDYAFYSDDVQVNNFAQLRSDKISIQGTIVSGSEGDNDVFIHVTFDESNFGLGALDRKDLQDLGLYDKTFGLGDSDTFSLELDISGLYTNVSSTIKVHVMTFEGDFDSPKFRVVTYSEFELMMCQGVEAPAQAEVAGGRWVYDSQEERCDWLADDPNGWTYDPETGEFSEPIQSAAGDSDDNSMLVYAIGGGVVLLIIVMLSLLFMRGGDSEEKMYIDAYEQPVAQAMDPMEQYVQQLIAQGYPEATARAYAQQHAAYFQQQQ